MCSICFEVNKNTGFRSFTLRTDTCSRSLTEFEAIEIMVSFIRAQFEIDYISERKPEIFQSTERLQLIVMEKDCYGLKVILKKDRISVTLFHVLTIVYDRTMFHVQCAEIYRILNQEYSKNRFDFRIFSPIYLEHMLGVDIPRIEKMELEQRDILSLYFVSRPELKKVKINEHEVFRQLQSGIIEEGRKSTNHYFENNEERVRNILAEVSDKPERFCAVVYGNEDVVRDGTHRLACMYYLFGNIEVPVLKVYVTNPFYSYTMYRKYQNHMEMEVIR